MQKDKNNWYTSWFDTPYYHILYKERDETEAAYFMNRLMQFLKLTKGSEILDLACGKGRHAQYLNTLGYDVTGVDLSSESIAFAKQFENETLRFKEHDMCLPFPKKFDAVVNLFTSFGYFEKEEDNLRTIKAIKEEIKPNGFGVIDFLNVEFVKQHIVPSEIKVVDGISFHINRKIEDGYIIKGIKFSHNNNDFLFEERVKAISLEDFQTYFDKAGITLKHCFGDYNLQSYSKNTSERLILIFSI